MIGEQVVVERDVETGEVDKLRVPITAVVAETVENVLVAPGPRTDLPDTRRPHGVVVAWTLHFPKPYATPLRGARISVRGEPACKVIGDPKPYTAENTPGEWWMPVELEEVEG